LREEDFPFDEVVAKAREIVLAGCGDVAVFFKFTCSNCGSRQTFDTPNVAYEEGTCEECGHVTDVRAQGGNYLVVIGSGARVLKETLRGDAT
jgi:hypothetical protein